MRKKFSVEFEVQKMVRKNLALGMSRARAGLWKIVSLGTARTYGQTYTNFIKWLIANGKDVQKASHQDGEDYLIFRSGDLCQVTLNRERIALQHHFKKRFQYFLSLVPKIDKSPRRYTYAQVSELLMTVNEKLGTSIAISVFSGIRASELLTIAPAEDQPENHRAWLAERFLFLNGCKAYTVKGKGGLVRKVMLPAWLAVKLENLRLPEPVVTTDREIYRHTFYDLIGGKNFSNKFSVASKKILGFSHGAHGLRGTYAQIRLASLVKLDVPFKKARLIIAQELGHFSPANLRYYLPGSCFFKFLISGGRCELKAHDPGELTHLASRDYHSLANASILHY